MPIRHNRQNVRFTTLLFGVVLLVITSTVCVVAIGRTPDPQFGLIATVTGLPSMLAMQLLQMMRSEQNQRDTREELKVALAPIAAEVKQTAGDVKITAENLNGGCKALPVNREDLKQMITEIVERVCSDRGMLKDQQPPPRVQT